MPTDGNRNFVAFCRISVPVDVCLRICLVVECLISDCNLVIGCSVNWPYSNQSVIPAFHTVYKLRLLTWLDLIRYCRSK